MRRRCLASLISCERMTVATMYSSWSASSFSICFTLFAAILAFHRTLVIDGPDAAPPAPDAVSETASPVAENPAAEAPAAEPSAALA